MKKKLNPNNTEENDLTIHSKENNDEFLWLEDVESARALNWVKKQNKDSIKEFTSDSQFAQFERDALKIIESKDKIPYSTIEGNHVFNFWQDDIHIRGIWRRTSLEEYKKPKPDWEILLDIDKLAEIENENWVWKGSHLLPQDYNRCILSLSRGGKDATVLREYDISQKCFVTNGFQLPEAKSGISWINENAVLVSTEFGSGSLSDSGYPTIVKLWKRGEPLSDAQVIMQIDKKEMGLWPSTQFRPERNYVVLTRATDFFTMEILLLNEDRKLQTVKLPKDAIFQGFWCDYAIAVLRSDWRNVKQGSLVALNLKTDELFTLFQPGKKCSVCYALTTQNSILLNILDNIGNAIYEIQLKNGEWESKLLPFKEKGMLNIIGSNDCNSEYFIAFENFLSPTILYLCGSNIKEPIKIKSLPVKFDAKDMEFKQKFSTSKDGTEIPYYLVSKKGLKIDGNNPVLLYGYGGFEIPMMPGYRPITGKLWLEKGGVFVLSNIRGGGEFGPAWHQAALKKQRHKSFEDFISIAEDMIKNKITSPKKLAIMGGSNGGLLVGTIFTKRPELFKGVVCQVPLLDMLRYHKLLAGASWISEYGDPDDPNMRDYLANYSPYHNIVPNQNYPRVFFYTSTKDDRVHPGHARKMVAKMKKQGHHIHYYENIEGGHSAGANLKQQAKLSAMEFIYLHKVLNLD